MRNEKRLRKLEQQFIGGDVTVRLKAGGTATLVRSQLLDIFLAIMQGEDTPETRIMLDAQSWNDDSQLFDLAQAVRSSESPRPPTELIQ